MDRRGFAEGVLLVVIGLVILLGGGYYVMTKMQNPEASSGTTQLPSLQTQSNTTTQGSSSTTQTTSQCAQFSNLKQGDTDATTNGEVSELQAFLGISPTTGTYGAQTSIGYQNKCGNLGNSEPASVPGMSEYTDSNFGFSFWYPVGWTVTSTSVSSSDFAGTSGLGSENSNAVPSIIQLSVSNGVKAIYIGEITSSNGIVDECGKCADHIYFDPNKGEWMDNTPGWTEATGLTNANLHPADLSQSTMGGLHIFWNEIVPLTADNFIVVVGTDANAIEPLTKTIVATSPVVATPVSTAQQTATIESEANAYGVSSLGSSNNSVALTNSINLSALPTSGPKPLLVTFSASAVPSGASIDFGDGTTEQTNDLFGNGTTNSAGYCGAGPDFFCSIPHVYTSAGTYTVTLKNYSGIVIGTGTINVTGSSASSFQTYTNSQYGFTLQYPNSVQINTNPETINAPNSLVVFGPVQSSFPVTEPGWGMNGVVTIQGNIYVNVSSNATDVANCMAAANNPETLATNVTNMTIHGINFLTYESDQPATGMEEYDHIFSTIQGGVCYSIYSDILGVESGHLNAVDAAANDAATSQLRSQLDSIVESFSFTQ